MINWLASFNQGMISDMKRISVVKRMQKRIFGVFGFFCMILVLPTIICAQVKYKVDGHLSGLSADIKVYLLKESGEIDSVIAQASDGNFSFAGRCPEMTYAGIVLGSLSNVGRFNKQFTLFLDGTSTRISGKSDDFGYALIEGSALNEDARRFEIQLKQAKTGNRATEKKKAAITAQYMAQYPLSYRGLIETYFHRGEIPIDSLKNIYRRTSSSNRKSKSGRLLHKYILSHGIAEIGKKAPDFSLKDINGNTINLKDYRGKYVLLEFWAGYCVPCRTENPLITNLYTKYRSQGFEVIGMGLDVKESIVKWAVKDGNTWNSVVLAAGLEDGIAAEYNVVSIPYSVLINRKGNIIARGLRESQEDEEFKVSKKLNEIFSRESAANAPH